MTSTDSALMENLPNANRRRERVKPQLNLETGDGSPLLPHGPTRYRTRLDIHHRGPLRIDRRPTQRVEI